MTHLLYLYVRAPPFRAKGLEQASKYFFMWRQNPQVSLLLLRLAWVVGLRSIETTLLEFSGGRMLNLIENFKSSKSGILCVLGAFLIQVCAGSYHGTFGNLLPYFTSYLKQVRVFQETQILICQYIGSLYWDSKPFYQLINTDSNSSIQIEDKPRFD